MPILLAEYTVQFEYSDIEARVPLVYPSGPRTRAPGLHQSDILAPLARKLGYLGPDERDEEEMPWVMAMGVATEEFLFTSILKQAIWQPGERTKDDISVNPDGLGDWQGAACIEETKYTEKRVAVDGEEFLRDKRFWMWRHQGAAYLHVYGLNVIRWTIMFYRGDRRGSGHLCKQYVVWFEHTETRQTWEMLQAHRYLADRKVVIGTTDDTTGNTTDDTTHIRT